MEVWCEQSATKCDASMAMLAQARTRAQILTRDASTTAYHADGAILLERVLDFDVKRNVLEKKLFTHSHLVHVLRHSTIRVSLDEQLETP